MGRQVLHGSAATTETVRRAGRPLSAQEPDPRCRAVMPRLAARYATGSLAAGPATRVHKNIALVALANKLARIVWAVLARGGTYETAAAAN